MINRSTISIVSGISQVLVTFTVSSSFLVKRKNQAVTDTGFQSDYGDRILEFSYPEGCSIWDISYISSGEGSL